MILNQDFKEFIESLNANEVRYLVVGGYAVAIHGHPRTTGDLDVWVEMKHANVLNLLRALEDFGFGALNLKAEDFLDPELVVQFGYPPRRIDILTALPEIDFAACYARRKEFEIEGTKVNFIDLENLKKTKRATGRYQDLADVENLE